mgnify:CR=1 FL=1
MVDDHRRVEPRGIIGTGMATDPDRIRELEEEQARKERHGFGKPKRSFSKALEDEPAKRSGESDLERDIDLSDETPRQAKRDNADNEEEENFSMNETDVGETISASELHHRLMRFRR